MEPITSGRCLARARSPAKFDDVTTYVKRALTNSGAATGNKIIEITKIIFIKTAAIFFVGFDDKIKQKNTILIANWVSSSSW